MSLANSTRWTEPRGPEGPAAPAEPVGPAAPTGLERPAAAAAPEGPVAPAGPAGPSGPERPEQPPALPATTIPGPGGSGSDRRQEPAGPAGSDGRGEAGPGRAAQRGGGDPLGPAPGRPRQLWVALRRFGSPRRLAATWRFAAEITSAIRRRRAEPRLTIAVDANSFFETLTGVGWYLHRLLAHLAARDDVRLRLYGQSLVFGGADEAVGSTGARWPAGPALERVVYQAPDGLVVPPWRANLILRRLAPLLVAADGNRVLFAPNYLPPPLFRFAAGARVAMVHDLAIYRVPRMVRPDSARALAAGLERALLEADLLLTPSRAVRGELIARGISPGRVRAIHHGAPAAPGANAANGADSANAADSAGLARTAPGAGAHETGVTLPGLPPRYALHVGTLEPRKNLATLLAAWRQLVRRSAAAPALVVAGGYGWKARQLARDLETGRREGWLLQLGYVTADYLAALYRGAFAVVLPSFYEGFGLPVVEALAAGVPLVLSDIPVFHEVAGAAALYASPARPEEWVEQLERLQAEPGLRPRLLAAGESQLRLFDWRHTAEETLRAWRAAAEE